MDEFNGDRLAKNQEAILDLPGVQDSARATEIINSFANLDFRLVADGTAASAVDHPAMRRRVSGDSSFSGRQRTTHSPGC